MSLHLIGSEYCWKGRNLLLHCCLVVMGILVLLQSFGGVFMIVQASTLVLGTISREEVLPMETKHFKPALLNYKQSYTPASMMNFASIFLRGLRNSKIAGGTQASTNEFPFIVSIQTLSRQHYCGGSLIAPNFVLSAAHCFVTGTTVENPTSVYVLPGTNDRACTSCTRYRGKTIRVHPHYDDDTIRNDIAILELQTSIPVDGTIISLANVESGSFPTDGSKSLTVAGWGYTTGTVLPRMLMKTDVTVNPKSVCFLLSMTSPNQICAGGNGRDSCAGDSGGPLFRIDSSNNFVVVGIVSYGDDGCGTSATFNNKGVYTNTTHYLSFIQSFVPSVGVKSYTNITIQTTPTINMTNTTITTTNMTTNATEFICVTYTTNTTNTISSTNLTINNITSDTNETTLNNSTWSENTINSTSNITSDTNETTTNSTTVVICSPLTPTVLNNSTSNSNNSSNNSTTILTDPNASNIATPYFHYIVSSLIILFISTCFNNLVVII